MIAGNKPDLVERITNYDLNMNKIPSNKEKIDMFLQPTKRCVAEEMPLISQHYYETFAAVDRFAQHLGYAPYSHKIRSDFYQLPFDGSQQLQSIFMSQQGLVEDTQETFKHYLLSLSNSLLE